MKIVGKHTLAAAVFIAAFSSTSSAVAQEVTLKFAHFLPVQAYLPKNVLEPWAEKIEAESEGRIKIERFYAMSLGGKPTELMDQVLDGVTDMALTLTGYTPGRFPRSEAFELPFMMTNSEATSRAYWDYAEKHMFDADFKDYKILGVWVHGPGQIHSTDPIRVPADLNGVKLRSPTRITNMMFAELGATSVGMPVPAVPEALSKGVIDATALPWEVTGGLKIPELVTNHTEFGDNSLYTATFVLPINLDVWNGIPADLQEIIMNNSGAEFSAFGGGQMQRDDAPSREVTVDLGNNIIELSEEEIQQWRDAASGVEAKWIADMDSKGIDGAALVKETRDLITKYTDMQ